MQFTPKEKEYLVCLASGLTVAEAALAQGVSVHTGVAHLRNMRMKTGARNVTHLVAMAVAEGLVKP
jgi:DNA-binding CsgD family transcriptional regulator